MRGSLGKFLRRKFSEKLAAHCHSFMQDRSAVVPNGWRVFRDSAPHGIARFLVLCIDQAQDRFTVEAAWSATGEFPAYCGLGNPRAWPEAGIREDSIGRGALRFRLSYLWQPKDFWWSLSAPGQAKARADSFEDAVALGDPELIIKALQEEPVDVAAARIPPAVEDAVAKIVAFAIPYFDQIDDKH